LQEPDLDLDKFEEILEENSEPEKYARLLRCQVEGRALAGKKGAAAAAPKGMNLVEYAITKGSAELLLRILSYNNSSEVAAVFKEAIRNIDFAVVAPERKALVKGILQRAFSKEFNENPTKDILSKDSKDLKDDEITQYIKETVSSSF